ncbi:pilin protein [[Haemophilus] ducreyi]|uniref:Fimbrial major pilin protein n=3 Tax=Haemophilus ducreyi TaxID=730 RepID=Q7VP27_HAEDU|nr:fimbrial protein [[Haemophilus] ducreyi]AAP95260.1 putative fimbrial major pilin protein [[Haemophilus] ducreyi 35000HP]AKO30402.1 pilin protein [[Haemophilus] ducreyi]AKO31836.1 pilin protein [[Haemophilus] ducreyi]AKO34738.1 pilin protein [[Haemophilus] ducreyi]AKO36165.1 pilin protein [[Haemophilus] ducreyi]
MKKSILAALISGTISISAMAAPPAGEGVVNFKGTIVEAACSVDPSFTNQTVDLGQTAAAKLVKGGTSRPVPFTIKLVDCETGGKIKKANIAFTGNIDKKVENGLAILGQAKGAAIQITGLDGKPVKLDGSKTNVNIQDGDNSLQFSAYLKGYPTAAVGRDDGPGPTPTGKAIVAGEFTSLVNFTMSYE